MTTFYNRNTGLWIATCPTCGVKHGIPEAVYEVAQQRCEEYSVYCPNGHSWHYPSGESREDKLRRERDLLRQREAMLQDDLRAARDELDHQRHRANGYKGAVTRLRNRAKAGVCPCCNRTFQNLRRHMESQHPDWHTEPETPE